MHTIVRVCLLAACAADSLAFAPPTPFSCSARATLSHRRAPSRGQLGRRGARRWLSASKSPKMEASAAEASAIDDASAKKLGRHLAFADYVIDLQARICAAAEEADGKGKFIYDRWERGEGKGFGITRVLEGGNLWEKAACSVSIVRGELSEDRAAAMSSRGRAAEAGQAYAAAACSLVFHSASPMVPTFRADVRHFQIEGQDGWYGGGADLTPYYLYDEDAEAFHAFYKEVCDKHDPTAYGRFKQWCDDYFFIPARQEHRGVGGIFFDDLIELHAGGDPLPLVKEVGEGFMPSYLPIAEKRRDLPFSEAQRQWQLVRRGRYLEFNLLYDRGVRFGLDGQGRTESVMVSAPPLIAWKYDVKVDDRVRLGVCALMCLLSLGVRSRARACADCEE